MIEKHFNKLQFIKIVELMDIDPVESKKQFIRYLDEFPTDFSAYAYFSSLLITLGEIDDARKVIDESTELAHLVKFDRNEKYKYFKESMLFSQLRLLSYQEKYSELYRLINDNREIIEGLEIHQIEFYCKNKLGLVSSNWDRKKYSYSFKQMREYREEDFLKHIRKHMTKFADNYKTPNQNLFALDFPISEVIDEVKKYIPGDKKIFRGFLTDVYTFKYNACGRDNNKITDYFSVICFHNTSNIITMCPVSNVEYYPWIDLSYMKHENEKVKRKSQIDRFNARYNR